MRFSTIIEKKRDGKILSEEEIQFFIDGVVSQTIPDYQISALLMAIYFNGMTSDETAFLTKAMMYSGDVVDLRSIPGIKVDKHSTGGVGDKTTLALTAMVAACGAKVAKMSGRGLGHTGGTLDKLESINHFNIYLTQDQFIDQVSKIGLAVIGQTGNMVPADKRLYALRDVTGTVRSIPLITSSIMSKKLASGSDAILLDVKFGEGAFMRNVEEATILAQSMIEIGKKLNKNVVAILTNMNQPLGNTIGNALEVKEAVLTLQGKGPKDFETLCLELGSIMLVQAQCAKTKVEAYQKLQQVIQNGSALEKLKEMVVAQGGDVSQITNLETLPTAKITTTIIAKTQGYIHDLNAMSLGTLAMKLGAGRAVKDDVINFGVGIELNKKVGDFVTLNEPLAIIHHDQQLSDEWINEFYQSFIIKDLKIEKPKLIEKIIE